MRHWLALTLLVLVGCSGKGGNPQARVNLKAQVEEYRQAAAAKDADKIAGLTHSSMVEKHGGAAKFLEHTRGSFAILEASGYRLESVKTDEPGDLVEATGELYAVAPLTVVMSSVDSTITLPSYLVGVSTDAGATWKFVSGGDVEGDRNRLRNLLPRLPVGLALPPHQQPSIVPKK